LETLQVFGNLAGLWKPCRSLETLQVFGNLAGLWKVIHLQGLQDLVGVLNLIRILIL